MDKIRFIENNISKLETAMKNGYEEIMGVKIKAGDPVNDFISWVTYVVSIVNNNINFTGKMNLLRYSQGVYLEALGELVGVKRNLARGAKATIKYTFSKIFAEVITIPKGHKVAAGNLYFELDNDIELEMGKREVIGKVTCLTDGIVGNNLQKGEINTIVDDIPYLHTVENLNISSGGADQENDESLRERIRLKPTSFSTAGPIASNYSINFKWWLNKEDDVTVITSSVNKAVEEYKKWQKEKLGRDINPNKLVQLLIQAGAKRVEIVSPIFTKIEKTHIAQDTSTTASYQGVEDE